MFIDIASVIVRAGKGGNGIVSFHTARGLPKGGPDGGDGGHGGDVVFIASTNENTLANFRYQKELVAEDGKAGGAAKMHGRNGKALEIKVPVGTQISNDGVIIADFVHPEQQVVVAKGGKGGFGNAHFTSSTRQAPKVAEKGELGDEHEFSLELKMIADVGLVGMPNAGKSTLLAHVSNARPEIANYAFTTLRPNLGVVKIEKGKELLFADIPGLIEGASEGKGLGDDFLRHVERTKVLLHMIDAYSNDIVKAYTTIQEELKAYKIDMSTKPQLVVINKIDGLDDEIVADLQSQLKKATGIANIYAISAVSGAGLQKILYAASEQVEKLKKQEALQQAEESEALPVITINDEHDDVVTVDYDEVKNSAVIRGKKIERFAARTDFESEDGVRRLRDIMRKMGILKLVEKAQVDHMAKIYFGDNREDYMEY